MKETENKQTAKGKNFYGPDGLWLRVTLSHFSVPSAPKQATETAGKQSPSNNPSHQLKSNLPKLLPRRKEESEEICLVFSPLLPDLRVSLRCSKFLLQQKKFSTDKGTIAIIIIQ